MGDADVKATLETAGSTFCSDRDSGLAGASKKASTSKGAGECSQLFESSKMDVARNESEAARGSLEAHLPLTLPSGIPPPPPPPPPSHPPPPISPVGLLYKVQDEDFLEGDIESKRGMLDTCGGEDTLRISPSRQQKRG